MEKFDVLVVGAGTAGCLAAKTVAEKGLKEAGEKPFELVLGPVHSLSKA